MSKFSISFFFLIILASQSYSQIKNEWDSLLVVVEKQSHDSIKINLLIDYSRKSINNDISVTASQKAVDISNNMVWIYQFKAKSNYAQALYNATRNYESIAIYKSILEEFETLDNEQLIDTYINLSESSLRTGALKETVEVINMALTLSKAIGNIEGMANSYLILGRVYYSTKEYELSREYSSRALRLYKEINNENEVARIYNNLGISYSQERQYDIAIMYFDSSMVIRKKYNMLDDIALLQNNLGVIYEEFKDYHKALSNYNSALKLNDKVLNKTHQPLYLINIGNIHGLLHHYDSGIYYLDSAIILTEKSGNIDYSIYAHQFLSELYYRKGEFKKAYDLFEIYTKKEKEQFSQLKNRAFEELEIKFKLEKAQTENKLLLKEQEINTEKQKRQLAVLISIAGGLVTAIMFIIIIYYFYKKKIKTNRLLSELNVEISNQNVELKEQKEEIEEQAVTLADANEEIKTINHNLEKTVLSRTRQLKIANHELQTFLYRASHDLKGPLASIFGLTMLAKKEAKGEILTNYIQRLNHTAKHMDRTLDKLMALNALTKSGAEPENIIFKKIIYDCIFIYQEIIDKKNIQLNIKIKEIPNFYSYPLVLRTIFTHLLDNCINYNKPSNGNIPYINIDVSDSNKDVIIKIKDNGIGIESDILPNIFKMFYRGSDKSTGNGLGLYIVYNSIKRVKGKIKINSQSQEYTEVVIKLPKDI